MDTCFISTAVSGVVMSRTASRVQASVFSIIRDCTYKQNLAYFYQILKFSDFLSERKFLSTNQQYLNWKHVSLKFWREFQAGPSWESSNKYQLNFQ